MDEAAHQRIADAVLAGLDVAGEASTRHAARVERQWPIVGQDRLAARAPAMIGDASGFGPSGGWPMSGPLTAERALDEGFLEAADGVPFAGHRVSSCYAPPAKFRTLSQFVHFTPSWSAVLSLASLTLLISLVSL